jgi:DNA-binding NarL/FixJ family response regulator
MPDDADFDITPRHAEVLECLRLGLEPEEIAGRLHLSPHTVGEHRRALRERLGRRNMHGLVGRACDHWECCVEPKLRVARRRRERET